MVLGAYLSTAATARSMGLLLDLLASQLKAKAAPGFNQGEDS